MTTFSITMGAKIFTADTAPVIEINQTTIYHVVGYNYKEYGVTCYHKMSTERRVLKPTMSPTINNRTPVGTYNITYSITTNIGGTVTASRIIIVVRQPTIAMVGSASITRYVGEQLNDPGYTFDIKGIMIDPQVVLTNSPPIDAYRNLTTAGTYNVTYTMSYSTIPTFVKQTFTREIIVKNRKPTITVNPTVVYWKQGVTYDDNLAGVSGNPVTTDTSSVTTNPSDLTTISGSVNSKKDIIYTATNADGEKITATRVVRFIQQPTLTLKGNATINVQTGDIWVDPGYDAKDAFGITSYEVGITGVPVLDLENRMITPATYTVTYTLRVSNTPSTQITSVVTAQRTVNVVNPSNPPVLTVTPKRVYHRHLDTYTDTGVSAKTYDNISISAGISAGNLQTTSITRKYDKISTTITNIADIKNLIGEYTITYEVTHNGVTVKDTRYVDVYSDLLDSNNFKAPETTTTTRYNAGVRIEPHPNVSSIDVHILAGGNVNQKIICNPANAPCESRKPFTFMTWVRVKGGQTGDIVLLKTNYIEMRLEIKDVADYFNGVISRQVKASLMGPIWTDSVYQKELNPDNKYSVAYPYTFRDSGRSIWTSMHDCPRLDEWLWFSLQYDGDKHFIMSINGTRYDHAISYYKDIISADITVACEPEPLAYDICNTRFIYRFLHIHEIQALYEYFVLSNTDLRARYDAFDAQLDVVNTYIDTFKEENNNSTDDTNFESALRNIRIIGHCAFQKEDGSHLQKALDIINKFETVHGPLFVGPTNSYWDTKVGSLYQLDEYSYGFCPYQHSWAQDPTKQLYTHRLARGILFFHHIVWDAGLQATSPYRHYTVSSEYPISYSSKLRTKKLQDIAEKAKWGTATYIKGQTANVTATAAELSIILKIRNRPVKGIPGDFAFTPQIRCTGMWVNNGVISEVTVPESMINKGIQICVGANMNDPSLVEGGHGGGKHGRLDRCSTFFLVDRSTVNVYNPVGGNIYVLVPYGIDIGMVTLTATNVVKSRMFRMINDDITGFHHTTSNSEWNAALPMVDVTNPKVAVSPAGPPTVDIETDYVLLHIPSQWIEENVKNKNWLTDYTGTWTIYDRIKDLAIKYDSICKTIMIYRGMIGGIDAVGAIDHPMFYTSVDMVMRTSAGGVGWPMVNGATISDTNTHKSILNWCIDNVTDWHEVGHMYCNRFQFSNEGESKNEFLIVCLVNQTCGIDLDSSYRFESNGNNSVGLDHAVIEWMKEDMFLNGNYMSYKYAGYQKRSWHKYTDIVALVGWDGFYAYQRAGNEEYERRLLVNPPTRIEKTPSILDTIQIVDMTLTLGIDIAPLMEFWGITDPDPAKQTAFRTNVRTIIERDLIGKTSIYFKPYGKSDMQQNCPVHKCRGVRTLLLYFKSLIPKTNKEMIEHVLNSWKYAYPVPSNQTLTITVVNNGFYNVYAVDGMKIPVLQFLRGGVITFIQSNATNTNHQIAIKDDSGNSYTTGVVSTGTPGSTGAQTVFTVPSNAPSNLRYYCIVDGNPMGNIIRVTTGTETIKLTNASPNDKDLGWWEKFFITDGKKWDDTKISAIENRIDAILADHGLTSEPAAVTGCIACTNNKPNFNPTPKMHPSWVIMPNKNRVNVIPYSALTFYITEDALGFIVKGDRDHNGSLATGKMPVLNIRFQSKILFYVSTVTPFYIMKADGTVAPDSEVKNQGITNGLLIWNYLNRYNENSYYGKLGSSVGTYKNTVIKVFGPL